MSTVSLTIDSECVALIVIDCPDSRVNVYTAELTRELSAAVERVLEDDAIKGAVITSAKPGFMAGADLKAVLAAIEGQLGGHGPAAPEFGAERRLMRRMETGGKPFAAAINGTALGGGFELCLACHYRVLSQAQGVVVGLPEVQVGLLPAGGGTQRLPRLIGIEAALPMLLEGSSLTPPMALALGIVDELSAPDDVVQHARRWVLAHPEARQPWDREGYRIPGGAGPLSEHALRTFYVGAARLRSRTQGNYPAPLAILSAVYEGTLLPVDQALQVEADYFSTLVRNPVARNLIRTQFIKRKAYERLAHRPAAVPPSRVEKLGVLGAGMMGAGIAYVAARNGISVVLLDATLQQAQAGRQRAADIAARMAKGRDAAGSEDLLERIAATDDYRQLAGCDMVIEAVFESRDVKADVISRALAVLGPEAVFASNTSTLPITGLAEFSPQPERFIGMHFFSPVERMPLLEIIMGRRTSQETLARAMDLAQRLRKTPIVVSDSPGFYTSRIFCAYVDEAMAMLSEGVQPALIENAARMAGMAVSPLAILDEVSLDLQKRVVDQAIADKLAPKFCRMHAQDVIARMNELGRFGRKSSAGFYDYPADGKKQLWPGLAGQFPLSASQPDVEEVRRRLLYIQALETVRCLDEGVIQACEDADIGATLGVGFPTWSGGPISLIETLGLKAFAEECAILQARHGARFAVPDSLAQRADGGRLFYEGAAI